MRNYRNDDECENENIETITTTTTITSDNDSPYKAIGNLKREFDNGQPYVIDPADKSKVWLNDKDDMYEDASDRIWKLV